MDNNANDPPISRSTVIHIGMWTTLSSPLACPPVDTPGSSARAGAHLKRIADRPDLGRYLGLLVGPPLVGAITHATRLAFEPGSGFEPGS